ncbi:hypothetical protein KOR42_49140 [Thalassoglobus neptunius]|uniref:Uncharacterized protein n=1 Tax=Thalassoglobus neptunius TaxID=1938619 RepID=A0A5C5VR41_9PLAN|nr:hypothetical protein [Thalassoglobus neptunius]TWT40607.1 hypothetical protein KOR42_49140 [Thalassoglobus neptunius]
MSEIKSPKLYRHFQKLALVVGVALTIAGYVMKEQMPALFVIGATVLLHGLIATVILTVEDRRTSEDSTSEPN